MKSYFLELPLSLIHEDDRYPDRDSRHIYEHLRHTLSHASSFPMPAIDVKLQDGKLVITDGHKYLRISRDLERTWIRAVLQSELKDAVVLLAQLPPGIRVISRDELEHEQGLPVVRQYHVYFFQQPLSPEAQKRFLVEVAGFFERLETPLIGRTERRLFQSAFPFEARCAEFEALIPVGDRSWMEAYFSVCQAFSRSVHRIVSFQGALFPT